MAGDAKAIAQAALTLAQQGRLDEAVAAFQRALQRQPDNFDAINNLGNIYVMQGKLDSAINCYRQALRLRPNYAGAHYNLGLALQDLDRFDEAAACFQEAVRCGPDSADAYFNLASAQHSQGSLEEALANFDEALRLRPDFAEARWNSLPGVAVARRIRACLARLGMPLVAAGCCPPRLDPTAVGRIAFSWKKHPAARGTGPWRYDAIPPLCSAGQGGAAGR